MNIKDFWPFSFKPRNNQLLAFEWLEEQTTPYMLLEAPVGSGKSAIGVTYSQYLTQNPNGVHGNSFILTPQRILQEQYETSFKNVKDIDIASLYGRANYTCDSKGASCEIGSIVKPKCHHCPFIAAKVKAKQACDTVLNYKLALISFAYAKTFNHRKLMILDECHTLENHLVDFDAVTVAYARCKKYKIQFKVFQKMEPAHTWLREYYLPEIKRALNKLESECDHIKEKDGRELTRSEIRKLTELSKLHEHHDEVVELSLRTLNYLEENFVLTWDKTCFQFKRLTGQYSFHKHMAPMADRFLFMSSTILNRTGFCSDLGIREDDAAFLSLESEFPEDNRPVYYMPQAKMNAKWKDKSNEHDRIKMINSVIKLLDMHRDASGIVHTGNYEISKWIIEQIKKKTSHTIFHHNPESGDDRNDAINGFLQCNTPSILVSPSITEGLDLREDLSRFAIIIKTPFGYLGNQWIKRRMEMSIRWYHRRALIDIIQGGGRIVRSDTDWGNVYILDKSWNYLYNQAYDMIPLWWKNAYRVL